MRFHFDLEKKSVYRIDDEQGKLVFLCSFKEASIEINESEESMIRKTRSWLDHAWVEATKFGEKKISLHKNELNQVGDFEYLKLIN